MSTSFISVVCLPAARTKVKVAVPYPVSPHALMDPRVSMLMSLHGTKVLAEVTELTMVRCQALQKGVDHSKVEAVVPFKNVELKVRMRESATEWWLLFRGPYMAHSLSSNKPKLYICSWR